MVGGAAAGIGFTTQFMGLRSLTYPCSIAQILAIIVMTLLRANIRRRLGREPCHTQPPAEYELDYLATLITFYPNLRGFSGSGGGQDGKDLSPDDVFRCGVKLPSSIKVASSTKAASPSPHPSLAATASAIDITTVEVKDTSPTFRQAASSEQLVRVRKRLGDLCRWTSKVSEPALALSKSIEAFMDTFVPDGIFKDKQKVPDRFSWVLTVTESTGAKDSNSQGQKIAVLLKREDEKWGIDHGMVEAMLSLWMAKVDAD